MFFAERVPPVARRAYKKDALSGMLTAMMGSLTGPFVSVIARGVLHASPFQISLLSVVPNAGSSLSLVWANLMEGRRKMPFAVGSWVASRSVLVFAFFCTGPTSFVALVSISSIIGSIAGPAYSALMKEIYPDSDRARIMGYARVCTVMASMVVAPIAGILLAGHNYRIVFPIAVVFGLASAFVFNTIRANDTHGDPSVPLIEFVRSSFAILREDPGFRRFCTGIFVAGSANLAIGPLIQLYQVDQLHVNTTWAGAFTFVTSVAALLGYIYWGSYIDRRTSQDAIAIQTVLLAVVPAVYCFVTRAWMVFPVAAFSALVVSGMDLSYPNGVLQYAPEDRIAQYQGLFTSLFAIRGMVAPLIGVFLYQTVGVPMKSIFLLAFGVMLLGAAIQYGGVHKTREPTSDR